jgi:hypothetical protein
MRNTIALITIAILLLAATAVFTAEIESISTSLTTNTVSNARPEEPQWVQYNPVKHGVWQWQRGNAKNGYQGHWIKTPASYKGGVLVWPNGAMEMAKCGNELPSPPVPPKVIIREVKVPVVKTEVKWRTRTITKTVPAPAPPPTVNNYYSFNSLPTMAGQMGGAYAPVISSTSLMGVGWQRVQDVNICISNDTGVNVVNNNANTNVNANNNAINVGEGSATGTATGTGNSTAGP